MAILARSLIKVLLFVCIFAVAVIFIRTYPFPMTTEQLRWWFTASERLGIRDLEDLELFVAVTADLIVTIFVYLGALRLWKNLQTRHRTAHPD